jgi:5-methylcytosine-specific restriction protein A
VARVPPEFIVGEIYRRRSLHEEYGGQRQGGISTPANSPLMFLFTSDSGHQYGYRDGFQEDSGTYLYTGEGQIGSMQMVRGNRAITDHQRNGKELHLFEATNRGLARYLGRATYLGHRWQTAPDHSGNPRDAIVFELAVEADLSGVPVVPEPARFTVLTRRLWSEPLEELRARALQVPSAPVTPAERKGNIYHRSEAVKVYSLRRSKGICEGCKQPAPFKRPDGSYYLEPHHIRRVSDSGPDHPRWVAALCPNCHRRAHSSEDRASFNEALTATIGELEE